ncbi:MAG: PepSY-associated TM helix domain-containing protein [Rhizobacter sp.]
MSAASRTSSGTSSRPGPGPGWRKTMAWPHTWAGVVIGSLLFAIFWMGTLSVFDREIDRWMQPGTRLTSTYKPVSFDRDVLPLAAAEAPRALQWGLNLPTERMPAMRFFYRNPGQRFRRAHHRPGDPHADRRPGQQGRHRLHLPVSLPERCCWRWWRRWQACSASRCSPCRRSGIGAR